MQPTLLSADPDGAARALRLVTITDNHLLGGLESRVATSAARFGAHHILAEQRAAGGPAEAAEIAAFRPAGLIAKADAIAARIEAVGADVVDLHPFHAAVTGMLAACLAGRPSILTLHGPASLALPDAPWQRAALTRMMDGGAVALVAVSAEVQAAAFRQWPGRLCEIIPNGVIKNGRARPDDGRCLAMATRLDADKLGGVLDLLRFVSRVPRLRLQLFGDGGARDRIDREIRRLGLSARVRCHGHVDTPAAAFSRDAIVAGCGRALLEGLVQGRRGLVVSATRVVRPVSRTEMQRLARANYSGRGVTPIPTHSVLRWLARGPHPRDRVADLVPTDMAARFADLARRQATQAEPAALRRLGQDVITALRSA